MSPEWADVWEIEDFQNAYRNWMEESMRARKHGILFDFLHDTPFEWDERNVPRDADREADGRYLRLRFAKESGKDILESELEYPCSFLEFLIALCYSIDDEITYDPDEPDNPRKWFWEIMSNMGLAEYDDEKMMADGILAYQFVGARVDMVMRRDYDYNGYPGMFPLRKPATDQRHVEIWYQANAYFIEKLFE